MKKNQNLNRFSKNANGILKWKLFNKNFQNSKKDGKLVINFL